MTIDIKVTKRNPGEWLNNEQDAREFKHAFGLIDEIVHEHLADLDAMTVANALCSVAANVLTEAGMTHADVAYLLETLTDLSKAADLDSTSTSGKA